MSSRAPLLALLALTAPLVLVGGQGVGAREVSVFNPLPLPCEGLVSIKLSFLPGEAYNNTIAVLDRAGRSIPVQLVNCTFYLTGHYRNCTLLLPASAPLLNASRYLITYSSSPLRHNVSLAGGLTVKLANLTLLAFNATGSYVVNVVNGIAVRGPGYFAVFSNSSLLHLSFANVGDNLAFADWPLVGFVLLKNRTPVASAYDLRSCRVKLLLNGSLLSQVEQVCEGGGFKLRTLYTFSGLEPIVRLDAALEGYQEGLLYYPFLRPLSTAFSHALVNGSLIDLRRERSFVPAPRWFALRSGESWLVAAVNYTSPGLRQQLEGLRLSLWRAYVNETNPLRKAAYDRLLLLHRNFSRLLLAGERVGAGEANVTRLLLEARALAGYSSELRTLMANLTSLLTAPEGRSYRLILLPREGSLNLAYQLNASRRALNVTVVLAASRDPVAWVESHLLRQAVRMAVVYAPLAARLDAPQRATVDDYIAVSADVSAFATLRNVSVELAYPKNAFRLIGGSKRVNFTVLRGLQRVEWVLKAVYEGSWGIELNVTSSGGSLKISRVVNVTLPPIVPRVVLLRHFNVTVRCTDALGRPLASYLVNLYENATRRLVASGFTNASGIVIFRNVSVGVYQLEVTDGLYSAWTPLFVYANRNVGITVGLVNLRVRVEGARGVPLPQAVVHVRDEEGLLVCAGFTRSDGLIVCEGLPRGNYTVSVRWQGALAGSSRVNLINDTEVVLRGIVERVTLFVTIGGRPAGRATITVHTAGGVPVTTVETDENGIATLTLLPGPYRITVSKGQYSATRSVDTRVEQYVHINLEISPAIWAFIAATALLWLLTAYVWYRRTSYVYRERERYKRLLQRLEEMHNKGEVEDKFYFKLKQEYDRKLNELSKGEAL